jgi:hypothetical protein
VCHTGDDYGAFVLFLLLVSLQVTVCVSISCYMPAALPSVMGQCMAVAALRAFRFHHALLAGKRTDDKNRAHIQYTGIQPVNCRVSDVHWWLCSVRMSFQVYESAVANHVLLSSWKGLSCELIRTCTVGWHREGVRFQWAAVFVAAEP